MPRRFNQRAAIRKRRVSRPLQARWAGVSPWGDKRGDKHLFSDVSSALGRRGRVAAQRQAAFDSCLGCGLCLAAKGPERATVGMKVIRRVFPTVAERFSGECKLR